MLSVSVASAVSASLATPPVKPTRSPSARSSRCACPRSCTKASCTTGSVALPKKPTSSSCMRPPSACAPGVAETTRVARCASVRPRISSASRSIGLHCGLHAGSRLASAATCSESVAVSALPSARSTRPVTGVTPSTWPNASRASCVAFAESEEAGRKLAWSSVT